MSNLWLIKSYLTLLNSSTYRNFSNIIFNSFNLSLLGNIINSFLGNIIYSLDRNIFNTFHRYLFNVGIIFDSWNIFCLVLYYFLIYISFFYWNLGVFDFSSLNWIRVQSALSSISLVMLRIVWLIYLRMMMSMLMPVMMMSIWISIDGISTRIIVPMLMRGILVFRIQNRFMNFIILVTFLQPVLVILALLLRGIVVIWIHVALVNFPFLRHVSIIM